MVFAIDEVSGCAEFDQYWLTDITAVLSPTQVNKYHMTNGTKINQTGHQRHRAASDAQAIFDALSLTLERT